jgi:phosphatidylglycerophosphate synthase
MKKKPTFMEWLKSSKKNKRTLIFQILFIIVMFIGLLLNLDDIEKGWAIIISDFLLTIIFLCIFRVYSIYTNLLRIDWFNKD